MRASAMGIGELARVAVHELVADRAQRDSPA